MAKKRAAAASKVSTANLGFEAKLGTPIDRVHRELTDADLARIVETYHTWRGDVDARRGSPDAAETADRRSPAMKGDLRSSEVARSETGHSTREVKTSGSDSLRASAPSREYSDIPGFCKSATTAEISAHGHMLTPGRYVGAEEVEDDGESFDEKMPRLVAELHAQFVESAKLEQAIKANLRGLGFDWQT